MVTKIEEAIDEGKAFPRAGNLKDALRATVMCRDGDAFVKAYTQIVKTFKLKKGHGKLKNLLNKEDDVPRMMISVIYQPKPDYVTEMLTDTVTEMLAEIQLHLTEIKHQYNDASHKYYELDRQPRKKFMELIEGELIKASKSPTVIQRWLRSKLNLQRNEVKNKSKTYPM